MKTSQLSKCAIEAVWLLLICSIGWLSFYSLTTASGKEAPVADCPKLEVPDNAELVYLGMLKARAAATVTFQNPRSLTGIVDVQVEQGEGPVYLVASSYANVILRFSGQIDRVTRVVDVGWSTMGFIGIEKDRGLWIERRDCAIRGWNPLTAKGGSFSRFGSPEEQLARVEALTGRPLDTKIIEHSFSSVAVPNDQPLERDDVPGSVTPDLDGPLGPIWKDILRAYPDGLIRISPDEVVSPVPAIPFAALR